MRYYQRRLERSITMRKIFSRRENFQNVHVGCGLILHHDMFTIIPLSVQTINSPLKANL